MPQATAGHYSRVAYLWEDAGFRNAPTDSDHKPFGIDTTLSTKEGSNNAVRLFNPDSPTAEQIIEQQFAGSWTAEFVLTNPWWLRGVIGEASSDGVDPTEHTFDPATAYPGTSMRILTGNTNTSTFRALEGCVVATATITFNIPGQVEISLDGAYAYEDGSISSFDQPPVNERALSYHDGRLSRDGSDLSFVQSLELTINTNTDLIDELGDRFSVDYSPKALNPSIDYARIVTDASDQERAYGGADSLQDKIENTVDFVIEADNGKTGASKNALRFEHPDVFPDSVSRSNIGDPTADLEDSLSELSPSLTAIAENSTASAR